MSSSLEQQRDWAVGLPVLIMDEILDRFVDLSDYIRFASVCVPWRAAALDFRNRNHHNKVRCTSTTQIPLLMLGAPGSDVFYNDGDGGVAEFYSVTRRKILNNFHLPSPYKTHLRIIGSAFGWLVNVDKNVVVTLFNPFLSSSDSIIRLPPVPCFNSEQFNDFRHIVKATLSKDPALFPDEYVVLMIYGNVGDLAFLKPGGGNGRWRKKGFEVGGYCDVIYSNSRGLFLGVTKTTGEVFSIDVTGEKVVIGRFTPSLKIRRAGEEDKDDLRYIVETPTGDVLQVYRFLSSDKAGAFRTLDIKVFKFDKTARCWCELKSLGDLALFVGVGSSVCVSASDFRGCQPGSVYYSLPYRKYSRTAHRNYLKAKRDGQAVDEGSRRYDVGVIDINGQRREPLSFKKYPSCRYDMLDASLTLFTYPIWVVPTFQHQ
ncbi:probable F-box protein at1g44080 [Phtheirospermum japonicum]|uniref:Probable F-box protein at1g44080 n=1 Tax=Phtheirospermum japonicum TaxID=374723 RepID=A0A830BRK9_9LAMI|nr:probable F-box protein at1g44080 [Phtheirospermum japonicum]